MRTSRSLRRSARATSVSTMARTVVYRALTFSSSLLRTPHACRRGPALPAHVSSTAYRAEVPGSISCIERDLCWPLRRRQHLRPVCSFSVYICYILLTWSHSLLNTVRQHDYYLLTEDFDSCSSPTTRVLVSDQTNTCVNRHPSVGPR